MKLSRKIQCQFYRLFEYLTKYKYYICDECHKIHKTDNKKIVINESLAIYVYQDCSEKLQREVSVLLYKAILDRIKNIG